MLFDHLEHGQLERIGGLGAGSLDSRSQRLLSCEVLSAMRGAPPAMSGIGGNVLGHTMSIFPAISIASSTLMLWYLTAIAIIEWPSRS